MAWHGGLALAAALSAYASLGLNLQWRMSANTVKHRRARKATSVVAAAKSSSSVGAGRA